MSEIYNGTFVLGNTSATQIVAGEGIKIDTTEPGVIKVSNDETLLCSAEGGAFSLTASENIYNFEYLDVWQVGGTDNVTLRIPTKFIAKNNAFETTKTFLTFNSELYTFGATYSVSNDGTVIQSTGKGYGYTVNVATTAGLVKYTNNQYNGRISRIYGINRISGGN